MMRHVFLLGMAIGALSAVPALAQGVRCSAFLHERDGSWRSFESGVVLGPDGPFEVTTGERFFRGKASARDEVARYLDYFCRTP